VTENEVKTLIIMHVPWEGPGTLGSFLMSRNAEPTTVELFDNDALPRDPSGFDLIVSMGGPMNVYEDEKHPFLASETLFLKEAMKRGIPMIGICLGAQIIARAAGAAVSKSPNKEVGWGKVSLTEAGRDDALFRGMPQTLDVLQWHEDMFHVPEGGTLLASSEACPNQAFLLRKTLALQFHVEATRPMLEEWFAGSEQLPEILERYDLMESDLDSRARTLYENFLAIVGYGERQ
jgi:GMP synthase-like glutamine amidotransferase